MEHKGTKTINTTRLILRRFKAEDAEFMFKNWANNPRVTEYLSWSPHTSVETTKNLLAEWVKDYAQFDVYKWAIELKDIAEPIGSISAVHINESVDEIEIGYCIGEKWWGNGYAAEAFKAVIYFCFNEIGAKRVCARHATENVNSGKVMKKCGLEYEGTSRKACKTGTGAICDLAVYSILNYDK